MPYKRTLIQKISDSLGGKISRIGELLNQQWLIYNPLTFWNFNRVAAYNAPAVIDCITNLFPASNSFVDIGCGGGAYAAEFKRRGIDINAIENSSYARSMAAKQGVTCYDFDLLTEEVSSLNRRFDLAYCFEVAEHIPTELSEKLVLFLTKRADTIIFTAAPPGQTGMGHINCQPTEFWQNIFEALNYHIDSDLSTALRESFKERDVVYWLTNNAIVYRKK